jgi:probable type IIS restriction/modification enzyme
VILSDIEQRIKAKIEAIGTPLKDWDIQINYGIKTGFNDAFIINGKKRAELIAQDPKSEEIIRPILRGRDIKRYGYEFADLYLINTHNGVKEKGIKRIDIDDYPAVKAHLDSFYKQLEKRQDKGDTPYNLRNCAYIEDFYKQKIVYQELTQGSSFCLDKDGQFWISNTGYLITGENLEYLILFLNSKIVEFVFKRFYSINLGNLGIRWLAQCIENLPIPFIKNTEYKRLKTDKEIEKYVCIAYNLSEEEMKSIIES